MLPPRLKGQTLDRIDTWEKLLFLQFVLCESFCAFTASRIDKMFAQNPFCLQQALQYIVGMKCPHCGKTISKSVIVKESGRIGGKKTAQRGAEYFRQLQAIRKTKTEARPPTET